MAYGTPTTPKIVHANTTTAKAVLSSCYHITTDFYATLKRTGKGGLSSGGNKPR